MKLRDQLSLVLTFVTGGVLGVSFLVVSLLVRHDETEDLDRAILAQAMAAVLLVAEKAPEAPQVIEGVRGQIPEIPAPVRRYEAIYASHGQVLSATRTFEGNVPSLEQLGVPESLPGEGVVVELSVRGNPLRGVVLPFGEGNRFRMLYALTRRSVDEDLRFLQKLFLALFLVAIAVTGLLSRFLGARLAADVGMLAGVARAVARGDLDARVRGRTRDSAELRALSDDMDRMIEQLGELVSNQRIFISHAAHELRSPLATLRGQLQLALRRERSPDEYREIIQDALAEVEALGALAEDLLVLARHQDGHSPRGAEVVVEALLQDALRMAQGFALQRAVQVRLLTPEEPLRIRGVRSDLTRAIRNLLDNAVAHTPPGGEVRVELRESERGVEIAVVDPGPGVPREDAPRIFAPFFRGSREQSGEIQGAGLGLAIVREIARAHGGDVLLDGAHAPGARFVLWLPEVLRMPVDLAGNL
jgi:two-component system heavy metal sensor histidine kinase CusS